MSSVGDDEDTFKNLVEWVSKAGGFVNQSLQIRLAAPESDRGSRLRGVFSTASIGKGDLLIRLPSSLALSGEQLESKWRKDRTASPWLRCLARFYQVHNSSDSNDAAKYDPYLASLPEQYETLWQWTDHDVTYLAGTTLGKTVQEEREQTACQKRYEESVQPYLQHLNIDHQSTETSCDSNSAISPALDFFQKACMCLSTRGFHMQASYEDDGGSSSSAPRTGYHGPYLLPVIDLLNHCEDESKKATTLRRDKDTHCFTMIAERDIQANEEILHSYGDKLTAAQILQTFGFVPFEKMKAVLSEKSPGVDINTTPAVLFRNELVESCHVVIESDFPKKLQQAMKQCDIEGEVWKIDKEHHAKRDLSFIPEQFSISPATSSDCLSDDIVTVCCIQFLPDDMYKELFEKPTLLDESVLEDYFLGKLVAMALLTATKKKMAAYPAISVPELAAGPDPLDDKFLLKSLLELPNKSLSTLRALYGLTIRLEENRGLDELRIEALSLMECLDNEDGAEPFAEREEKRAKTE